MYTKGTTLIDMYEHNFMDTTDLVKKRKHVFFVFILFFNIVSPPTYSLPLHCNDNNSFTKRDVSKKKVRRDRKIGQE